MLIDSGYHVDVAEDGVIAWDALLLNDYDLVVTDNSMPNLSGVQLIERLHTARMAMPVIMATATLPQEEFTRCPWLQPDAILLKPYSLAEFLGAVKDVLNASADVREGIAPLPIWQTLPSAMTLRL